MPIVAKHHSYKNSEHVAELRDDWPEDCYVQWGGSGIVLGGKNGARKTAFFEAFPAGGGFIRGEGETIKEAENAAFRRFEKESACQHSWGRRGYSNGGCLCTKCGAFRSNMMKPITHLGGFREPISSTELSMAIEGCLAPSPDDKTDTLKLRRSIWLRLRRAGIKLPEMPAERESAPEDDPFAPTPYAKACREVVFSFFDEHGGLDLVEGRGGLESLQGFFQAMTFSGIKWEYQDWLKKKEETGAEIAP